MTNKDRAALIRQTAKEVQMLEREQDKKFNALCRKLNIQRAGSDSNVVFDIVFNRYGNAKELVNVLWPVSGATKSSGTKGNVKAAG